MNLKGMFKKHKTAFIVILIAILLFISFLFLNALGEAERGHKGIGGEMFVFILPVILISGKKCLDDTIDALFRHK